jgi:hypothetical protein
LQSLDGTPSGDRSLTKLRIIVQSAVKVCLPAKALLTVLVVFLLMASVSIGAPIQRTQGVIVDLQSDHLWLKPDGQIEPHKFILKWKVRFNPPRLPLKGDRVQILYKEKDEGSVIYGLNYLQNPSDSSERNSESNPEK